MAIGFNRTAIAGALLLCFQCGALHVQSRAQTGSQADYSRAEALVRGHQWQEGLDVLHRLLQSDPRNLRALNLAGIACSAQGDRLQADGYFERALAVDPRFLPALKNLAISEFNAQRYELAQKHLLAVESQLPDDPTAQLYLGEIAYAHQDFKSAAEHLDHAGPLIQHDPNLTALRAVSLLRTDKRSQALDLLSHTRAQDLNQHSLLSVGVVLSEHEDDERAIPYFAEAFMREPDSYDIGFDLALACVRARQYATAIATMQGLVARSHDSSELENLLAEAFAANADTGSALDAYRKAIALDPLDDANYLDFAALCLDHRAFDDGMKVLALGLRVHPESSRLIFMRGVIEASEDLFDLAEKDFEQSTQLNPEHDFGTVGLGALYLERGNSAEALKVTRTQLRQRPDDPNLLYLLGKGLLAAGAAPGEPAFSEAEKSLERSVKLAPSLCLPHVSLGTIYLGQGRYAEAAAQFGAARIIDPGENSAYSHLAVAYRRLGQQDKAKEVLTRLQALLQAQRSGERSEAKIPEAKEPE